MTIMLENSKDARAIVSLSATLVFLLPSHQSSKGLDRPLVTLILISSLPGQLTEAFLNNGVHHSLLLE